MLGLLTAWAIGIHTAAKKPLQILYLSYTVDIARSKSATIKRIIESKRYQEVFPTVRLMKMSPVMNTGPLITSLLVSIQQLMNSSHSVQLA